MNIEFRKVGFAKGWTLTDDSIITPKKIIPLSEITGVKYVPQKNAMTNGVIQIFVGAAHYELLIHPSQNTDGNRAATFIRSNYGDEKTKSANQAAVKLETKIKEVVEKAEIRMRCKICGTVFCYNINDLAQNQQNAKMAKTSAKIQILTAISGSPLEMYASENATQKHMDKIVDFDRCPNCGSREIIQITEEELEQYAKQADGSQSVSSVSAADEIKKFKELLDSGVIAQEEFDAKKKQLLGL